MAGRKSAPVAAVLRPGDKRIVFKFAGVLFQWQPLDLLRQLFPAGPALATA